MLANYEMQGIGGASDNVAPTPAEGISGQREAG